MTTQGLRSSVFSLVPQQDLDRFNQSADVLDKLATLGRVLEHASQAYEVIKRDLERLQSRTVDIAADPGLSLDDTDARYLQIAENLGDLEDAADARTNLGLGTMATQEASAVAITGGTATGMSSMSAAFTDSTINYTVEIGPFNYTNDRRGIRLTNNFSSPTKDFIIESTGDDLVAMGFVGKTTGLYAERLQFEIGFIYVKSATLYAESDCFVVGDFTADDSCQLCDSAGSLGFFGNSGATRRTVSAPSSVVTTQTADLTYGSDERDMLNNLKTDVTNLRSYVNSLHTALTAYNFIA